MFHEILAQTNWEGVGVAVSMVLATATAGYVVNGQARAKRQRKADANDRENAAVVLKETCDAKHGDLNKLLEARKDYFDARFADLKTTVETGFIRIEKSLNGHKV